MDEESCALGRSASDAALCRFTEARAPELFNRMKTKRKAAPEVKIGAARALERLEAEEARLFGAYESAKKGRDPLEIKTARDAWLKTSESLRKFDLLVEAARRETGELMPVDDVKKWLGNLGAVLHMALLRATDDRSRTWQALVSAFGGFIAGYNPRVSAPCFDVPQVFFQALFSDVAGGAAPELWRCFRQNAVVVEALNLHRNDPAKLDAYLRKEMAKLESEKPNRKETTA
jgi:hypothetical protein